MNSIYTLDKQANYVFVSQVVPWFQIAMDHGCLDFNISMFKSHESWPPGQEAKLSQHFHTMTKAWSQELNTFYFWNQSVHRGTDESGTWYLSQVWQRILQYHVPGCVHVSCPLFTLA